MLGRLFLLHKEDVREHRLGLQRRLEDLQALHGQSDTHVDVHNDRIRNYGN